MSNIQKIHSQNTKITKKHSNTILLTRKYKKNAPERAEELRPQSGSTNCLFGVLRVWRFEAVFGSLDIAPWADFARGCSKCGSFPFRTGCERGSDNLVESWRWWNRGFGAGEPCEIVALWTVVVWLDSRGERMDERRFSQGSTLYADPKTRVQHEIS